MSHLDLATAQDARALLSELDAPPRLLAHSECVLTIAMDLVSDLEREARAPLGIDNRFVATAALLHDVGKILVPGGLDEPGTDHQRAGEFLLRREGASQQLAAVCTTHGGETFDGPLAVEHALVALANDCARGRQRRDRAETLHELLCTAPLATTLELADLINLVDLRRRFARRQTSDSSPTPNPAPRYRRHGGPVYERPHLSPELAFELLDGQLEAPAQMLQHAALTAQWAQQMLDALEAIQAGLLEHQPVLAGAILHHVGQLAVGQQAPGGARAPYEVAGYQLLRREGVEDAIARCCRSHSPDFTEERSLEELAVAVACACAGAGVSPLLLGTLCRELETKAPGKREAIAAALERLPKANLPRQRGPSLSGSNERATWPALSIELAVADMGLFTQLRQALGDLPVVRPALYGLLDPRAEIDAIIIASPDGQLPDSLLARFNDADRQRASRAAAEAAPTGPRYLTHVARSAGLPLFLLVPHRPAQSVEGILAALHRAVELAQQGELRRVALIDESFASWQHAREQLGRLREAIAQLPIRPRRSDERFRARATPLRCHQRRSMICLGEAHEPTLTDAGELEDLIVVLEGATYPDVRAEIGGEAIPTIEAQGEDTLILRGAPRGEGLTLHRGPMAVAIALDAMTLQDYLGSLAALLDEAAPPRAQGASYVLEGRRGEATVTLELEPQGRRSNREHVADSRPAAMLKLRYRWSHGTTATGTLRLSADALQQDLAHIPSEALPPATRAMAQETLQSWPAMTVSIDPQGLVASGSTTHFTRIGVRGWLAQLDALTQALRPPVEASDDTPNAPMASPVKTIELSSAADAIRLLERLGAPAELLTHARIVSETAEELIDGLVEAGAKGIARDEVLLRAALHDAGKIVEPAELHVPGSRHEAAGEALLLEHGVAPALARICRSHARWDQLDDVSSSELLAALADKLWRGKRDEALEHLVANDFVRGETDWFRTYTRYLDVFERVAEAGGRRLELTATHRARGQAYGGGWTRPAQIILSVPDPEWRRAVKPLLDRALGLKIVRLQVAEVEAVDALAVRLHPGEGLPGWAVNAIAEPLREHVQEQLATLGQWRTPQRIDTGGMAPAAVLLFPRPRTMVQPRVALLVFLEQLRSFLAAQHETAQVLHRVALVVEAQDAPLARPRRSTPRREPTSASVPLELRGIVPLRAYGPEKPIILGAKHEPICCMAAALEAFAIVVDGARGRFAETPQLRVGDAKGTVLETSSYPLGPSSTVLVCGETPRGESLVLTQGDQQLALPLEAIELEVYLDQLREKLVEHPLDWRYEGNTLRGAGDHIEATLRVEPSSDWTVPALPSQPAPEDSVEAERHALVRVPRKADATPPPIATCDRQPTERWQAFGVFDARPVSGGCEISHRRGFRFEDRRRRRALIRDKHTLAADNAVHLFIEAGSIWSRRQLRDRLDQLAEQEGLLPAASVLDVLVQQVFDASFSSGMPKTTEPVETPAAEGPNGLQTRLDYRAKDLPSPLGDTPLRVAWNDCPWTPTPRGYHLDDELRGHVWAAALENATASPFEQAALRPLCELFADWPTEELIIDPQAGLHIHGTVEKFTRVGLRGWLAAVESLVAVLRQS
jgi:hypothetical protein